MTEFGRTLKIGAFAALVPALAVAAWIIYPRSSEAIDQRDTRSERPPDNPPESSMTPSISSNFHKTVTLPEPEFTSDFAILLKSVIDLAKQRDHPAARAVSLKLREASSERVPELIAAIRMAELEGEGDLVTKCNVVAYLALAVPSDAFGELLTSLRNRWMLSELTDDRRAALSKFDGYPLSFPYYSALVVADRPLAGAIGFCILDAVGDEDHERFTSVSRQALNDYLAHDISATKQEVPDVWLSEVLKRLEVYGRSFTTVAKKLAKDFCADIADCHFFTERLRHQARMLVMEPPESFTELLAALREAKSEAEAGSLLQMYLEQGSLNPPDLRLVLGILRTSLNLDEATLAVDTALRGMDEVRLKRFAADALSLCLEPDVSGLEKAQLSAAVFSAANRSNYNGILRAWKASGSSKHERGLFLCDYPDAALEAIRVLIADCGRERGLDAARSKIMAYETALAIVELDCSTTIKLDLMADLMTNIGGSRDPIASPVLVRLIYSHQRFSGFDLYWMRMLNLFLDKRTVQVQLDTEYTHIELISTYELLVTIAMFQREFSYVPLPGASVGPLRKLIEDARRLFERFPDYRVEIGGKEALAAIEEIENSSWLK